VHEPLRCRFAWRKRACAARPADEPSRQLQAVWDAGESAMARGDVEAAVAAVLAGWTLPDARRRCRPRGRMQLRAYELREPAGEPSGVLGPLEESTARARLLVPALVAAGEHAPAGLPGRTLGVRRAAAFRGSCRHRRRRTPRADRAARALPRTAARLRVREPAAATLDASSPDPASSPRHASVWWRNGRR
jgi:hypothetical protein